MIKRVILHSFIFSVLLSPFIGNMGVQGAPEKLPLPRFVALRSNKVNSHVGPGTTYPTQWIFTRQDLPVEIIAEFDTWRKIKDIDGSVSWVHRSLLSGKRTVIIKEASCSLRREPQENAPAIAIINQNVIGKLKECRGAWCRLDIQGYIGWLPRNSLWGVYPHEEKI